MERESERVSVVAVDNPHRLRTHTDELRELLEKERKRADSAQERLSLYDQNFLQLNVGSGGVRVPGIAGGIGIVPYLVTKGAIFEPHNEGDAAGEVLILLYIAIQYTPTPTHPHKHTHTRTHKHAILCL